MALSLFILAVGFLVLLAGSYTDIKTREVPDWVNYGLIASALGIRLAYSLAASEWSYLIEGALGFAVFLALALAMFYAGQWGGGDAKMMMGLGALLGLRLGWSDFSVGFIMNVFLVGAVYGLLWSAFLALKNRHRFRAEAGKIVHAARMIRIRKMFIISAVIMLLLTLLVKDMLVKFMLFAFVVFYLSTFYLWIFIKAVERSCMYKLVPPEKLTEGDWIAKDVIVSGKRICGPKDLGIEMRQIRQLIRLKRQRKIGRILIKEGIPFMPSFLLGLVITYLFGNLFFRIV